MIERHNVDDFDAAVTTRPEDLFIELQEQATVERLSSGLLGDLFNDAPALAGGNVAGTTDDIDERQAA